jgi:hypothetical protein
VVSLESKWHNGGPAGSVAITGFDKGFVDGVVLMLNNAVHSQVVS